jgi:hypothetical protein
LLHAAAQRIVAFKGGVMKREELWELQERIKQLSNEELLDMLKIHAADYQEDSLEIARQELESRGLSLADSPDNPSGEAFIQDADPTGLSELAANTTFKCQYCGGKVRRGSLIVGDSNGCENQMEAIVQFHDIFEQRYCFVLACTGCGRVRLAVDFETIVERVPR